MFLLNSIRSLSLFFFQGLFSPRPPPPLTDSILFSLSFPFSFSFPRGFLPLPVFDFNPRSEEEIVARVLNALRTWHPRCCAVWARAPLTTPFPLFPPFSAFVRSFSFFSRPRLFRFSFALYSNSFHRDSPYDCPFRVRGVDVERVDRSIGERQEGKAREHFINTAVLIIKKN